ncbi:MULTISPECIES: capsule biosynthesis protein [unclassified Paracoccus (in: a-proteobacteria)]|uniref:capsule biosynthesis protein n=2 Tax=Paracoccus TaxID=265 RepID=UPI000FD8CD48|nr:MULTISPECIES: capsule biosynthesis protein [unclassified Paracoccus (in: a-proteobacteria)]AZY94343.1 capsule biosynthesis protein [Paracoccus sp. Arc7-R13]
MTTPPKARRYNTQAMASITPQTPPPAEPIASDSPAPPRLEVARRSDAPASDASERQARLERFLATEPIDDGLGDFRLTKPAAPSPEKDMPAAPPADSGDMEARLAAIRAEKLTERQLRIAKRIAALHQIEVSSAEEAVLRLRERGIDPSHRTAVGSILSSEGTRAQAAPSPNAPAVRQAPVPSILPDRSPAPPGRPALPSREELTEEKRAAEIYRIQRDLARRRRRRMAMLAMRLALFVFLPTALVGIYYGRYASPLYATVSQFQIQSAESGSGASGLSGMLGGSGLGTNQDAVAVQSYLTSRDAMLRLDEDLGFRRAFQDPSVDAIKRLPADATNEATFSLYKDSVKIGYDPTEGVLNMEVIAPDPQLSEQFSRALISYAEQLVDALTSRMRSDQMDGARETYQDAEEKMLAAQLRVQELQERLGVLDPVAESGVVMAQVSMLEGQLAEKQLELGQLQSNARPLQSRVDAVEGDIARLRDLITQTRQQLTQGNDTRNSLAAIGGELRVAEAEMLTRQEMLAAAAAQMETARIEANKQVRYLSLSIAPIPPDEATYPRAFQNTLVAFLVFSGIYLMLSLTASILREQVST